MSVRVGTPTCTAQPPWCHSSSPWRWTLPNNVTHSTSTGPTEPWCQSRDPHSLDNQWTLVSVYWRYLQLSPLASIAWWCCASEWSCIHHWEPGRCFVVIGKHTRWVHHTHLWWGCCTGSTSDCHTHCQQTECGVITSHEVSQLYNRRAKKYLMIKF